MTQDINDLLDDRMQGGGDFPDWWEPEDEGDSIKGIVTNVRDDPWAEEDDRDPETIVHVKRLDDGQERSVRPHKILSNLLQEQGVELGDLVQIEYLGATKTSSGHMANNYQLGVVKEDELDDLDIEIPDGGPTVTDSGSDDTDTESTETPDTPAEAGSELADPGEFEDDEDDTVDPSDLTVADLKDHLEDVDDTNDLDEIKMLEQAGKNRKSALSAIDARADELSGSEDTDEETSGDGEFDEEVLDFAENIVEFNDDLTVEDFDKYLNNVREFGVDPEAVAQALGYEVTDDDAIVEG